LDRHTMKRLLTFAVVLGCASATIRAQTATNPAIYAAPDDGLLVGVTTAALWSAGWSAAQTPVPASSCVILERASAGTHAGQGTEFYYVRGTYPPEMPFHRNLRDRNVREIVKKGGRFLVLEPNYLAADLERAQRACEGS
jgi:hypothetical protein